MITRKSISSLDLHYLAKEFQCISKGKIDNIYSYHPFFYLQVHIPNQGASLLKIALPQYAFLADERSEKSTKQTVFSEQAKKHLLNTRIVSVEQYRNERILVITCEHKDSNMLVVIELFSQGNIIVCDEQHKILCCLTTKQWKDRMVRKGEQYQFPESLDVFALSFAAFQREIASSDKESLLKTLALHLGLGGLVAEELLLLAGIDHDSLNEDPETLKKLFSLISQLRNHTIDPRLIYDGDTLIDFVPFPFTYYNPRRQVKAEYLSKAISQFLEQYREPVKTSYDKEIEKLTIIIERQAKNLAKAEKESRQLSEKGELIYHHYTTIKEVLDVLEQARQKHSWKEIKAKLKGHKLIKQIDEKEGKIILDL